MMNGNQKKTQYLEADEFLFREFFDPAKEICEHFLNIPEGNLYHYTSLEKFCKIIESEVLWLRDFKTLPDKKEVYYLKDIAKPIVADFYKSAKSKEEKFFWGDIIKAYKEQKWYSIYTASLCVNSNNEYLWKKYADSHKGVTIGFSKNFYKLDKHPNLLNGYNRFVFSNIHYGKSCMRSILIDLFKLFREIFFYSAQLKLWLEKIYRGNHLYKEVLQQILFHHMVALAPAVKRNKYKKEKEHRIYIVETTLKDLKLPIGLSRPNGDIIANPLKKGDVDRIYIGRKSKVKIDELYKELKKSVVFNGVEIIKRD